MYCDSKHDTTTACRDKADVLYSRNTSGWSYDQDNARAKFTIEIFSASVEV